jgi:cation:H+ antiporter
MGSPGVAVGNVVGSNICNILLILGLAAVLRPVLVSPRGFRRDGPALAAATLICVAALLWGEIGRVVGAVFVALLLGYVALAWTLERGAEPELELTAPPATRRATAMSLGMTVLGIALVIAGADFLVDASVALARDLGVSDAVIGLTVVAVGTSLPELATSVAAALRGRSDIAFGAVVGSNIYNILGILGVTALVAPLQIPARIMDADGWIMLAATAALALATITGWRINRMEGGLMLGAYAGYLGWMAAAA